MPLDGSAGKSKWTEIKQRDFAASFAMLLNVARNAAAKWNGELIVLDATAGPGVYADGSEGSPVIIARTIAALDRRVRVYLFERDPTTAVRLRESIAPFAQQDRRHVFTVIPADHTDGIPWFVENELPKLHGPLFGVIYVDANARTHLSFDALNLLARTPKLSRVDFLLNVAATSWWKRIRVVMKGQRYFYDDIKVIPKRYRWFRAPVGPDQWTMVFLSNYPKLAPSKRLGFWPEWSEAGQEILRKLNLTKPERLALLQPMLPFGPDPSIEHTRNTSDIPGTERSAPTSSPDLADSANDARAAG
jgi:hypothetical protein